jgi:cytochrome c553
MKFSAWMLAAALVALPIAPLTQAQAQDKKADAPATSAPVSMCIGCHSIPGYQASFPQVYRVPKIGGQSAQYIEAALKAYRDGSRNMPTMMGVARGLTDEQIAALGAYYAARGK